VREGSVEIPLKLERSSFGVSFVFYGLLLSFFDFPLFFFG
jgi:hypothetical protein